VARAAGARRLALYHHDPLRHDDDVDDLVRRAHRHAESAGYPGEVFAATEGRTISLAPVQAGRLPPDTVARPPRQATEPPALEATARTVVLAVHDPTMAATLRAAAEAEGLEVLEGEATAIEPTATGTHEAPLVIFEERRERTTTQAEQRMADFGRIYGPDVTLIVVTTARPPTTGHRCEMATDWLVWPSTPSHLRTKLRAWVLRRACRWQSAPEPPDESRRLASLRGLGVLDSAPEQRFDRYTTLACETFDVPIALVSLVDADRQWFKSRQGIAATETPRDVSLCSHAILDDEVLQVPDALDDPRFEQNPLVEGALRVRFYAGVPLKLADGSRVGTLCVIDHQPRFLDESQIGRLRELGKLVEAELAHPSPPPATGAGGG
jgi:GAF domain-containing protein